MNKIYSENEIIEALSHAFTFIWMERDSKGRVTTIDVREGFEEFKKILRIKNEF